MGRMTPNAPDMRHTIARDIPDARHAMPPWSSAGCDHVVPTGTGTDLPFVSIVVPTLNEEHYIEACLASLIGQWPQDAYEILVLDGGSSDRTRQLVASFRERHNEVTLLSNPRRLQSAAVNLAARVASPRTTVLVRADAHALYSPDFVRCCVIALLRSGATSVVVPMRTEARPVGSSGSPSGERSGSHPGSHRGFRAGSSQRGSRSGPFLQHAIAAAQSSRLGNGGAAHRTGAVSGFVEHGHHAAFDRRFFCEVGGYDESFTHNEDAELDVRAIRAGGRIWMCAEVQVTYYPRDRLGRLAQQYFRHGGGRARTLRKHKLRPKPRQLVPLVALAGCTAGLAAAPFMPALASLAMLYPASCLAWSVLQVIRQRDPRLIAGGLALMTMHLCWALGFLIGFARAGAGTNTTLPAADPERQETLPVFWQANAAAAVEQR
jgi:succinoglycan biosynthesis protein ExoA